MPDRDDGANEPPTRPQSNGFPVAGLGASAGGIRALQTFFDRMPNDSGMAFVVVMHLSPDHESNLTQVLQQRTKMPVMQVTGPVQVLPNHIYAIPPNKHLSMRDSHLELLDPQQSVGKRIAIDLFFRALSLAFGPRAISIVLSGTDSDGVIGIKHIKEQGGLTIAQDPTEAEFDGMPRAAIATGMVDWVLPVGEMPDRLIRFLQNEERIHVPPEDPDAGKATEGEDTNSGGPLTIAQVPNATDEVALAEVLNFLRSQTGQDFSHYKRATVLRRVARRMQVNLLEDVSSYRLFLRTHQAEVVALMHDMLISVTNFFRDREAFAALECHIPQLFAGKTAADQVRVWVAGCATGEEAYTVAILLSEHASKLEAPPAIQLFATDLDEDVISIARAGLYPPTIEADVSTERLRLFFQKDHGRYRIRKEIRERVLFSAHNLLKDSPFSRLDLITCRNLLIYLKREAQEALFDTFHFALRPGGLLFLGGSESMNEGHTLFAPLDKHFRLYVRRAVPRPGWHVPTLPLPTLSNAPLIPALARAIASPAHPPAAPEPSTALERRVLMFGDLHLTLLERYAPPSIVINDGYDIVHLSEHAGTFLQFAGGEVSTNLLKVVHPSLRVELRTALFRASKGEADVTVERVPMELKGVPRLLRLHVRPARRSDTAEGLILVVFELMPDVQEPFAPAPVAPDATARHLEEENQHLREQLDRTVVQYEGSVEELKASNEELQAINEEMRSATEELETSKEELQSINEELTTVNQELKSNLEELSRVNSDLQNLMASTEIGTIFLDRELQIKRFTPRVQELFNLIATDTGRPLSDITHRLNYPTLIEDAERVLQNLLSTEREVRGENHWFLARVLPYRTVDDHIDGVVLTFVDITERKRAEEALLEAQQNLEVALEAAEMGIWNVDLSTGVAKTSARHNQIFGYTEPVGAWGPDILRQHILPEDHVKFEQSYSQALETGALDLQVRVRSKDGSARWVYERGRVYYDEGGRPRTMAGVTLDFTGRKLAEEQRLLLDRETTLGRERNRMGQELHDTLAQAFTAIKLQLDAAEQELEGTSSEAQANVLRAREIALESLQEARRAVQALRAAPLVKDGLAAALEQMALQATQRLGAQVRCKVEGSAYHVPADAESELYRIAQEALTNALRHAHAHQIEVVLNYAPEQLSLRIADDGRGFARANHKEGFGLRGMRERAENIGGELRLASTHEKGTEILVTLPKSTFDGAESEARGVVRPPDRT